jgi:predicted permease
MDVRYALRQLRRQPLVAAAAVCTLALGIGANTSIFTVVNGVLLRPLPFEDADRLVLGLRGSAGGMLLTPDGELLETWRGAARSMDALEAYAASRQTLLLPPDVTIEDGRTAEVTAGYMEALRAFPVIGRDLEPEDELPGAERVAMLGWGFWQRAYGGRHDVVGEELRVGEVAVTIVGVAARIASIPSGPDRDPDVWLPLRRGEAGLYQARAMIAIGRLRDGVSIDRAEAEISPATERMYAQRDSTAVWTAKLIRPQELLGESMRQALYVMLGAVALVLLIACANVANLMLTRTIARSDELAVRGALGAGRSRLIRQLLLESLLFAVAGGLLGILIAHVGLRAIVAESPPSLLRELERVRIDGRVLSFATAVTLLTTLLFGVGPALRASRTAMQGLARGGYVDRRDARRGRRFAAVLVSAEIALSLVLMIGAGLMVRSVMALLDQDTGFDDENLVVATFDLPRARYGYGADPAHIAGRTAFLENVRDAARSFSGVEGAALVETTPPEYGIAFGAVEIEGRELVEPAQIHAAAFVEPDYMPMLGIRMLEGRWFDASEAGREDLIVIGTDAARSWFPDGGAVGQRIRIGSGTDWMTVVGVAADVPAQGLAVNDGLPQLHIPRSANSPQEILLIRTARDAGPIRAELARAVSRIDDGVQLASVATMQSRLAASLERPRFNLLLMVTFAVLALVLAAIGLYGVIAHAVGQRTREIGIRRALGAGNGGIMGMVVLQGMRPVLVGSIVGLVAAMMLGRLMESLLFGFDPRDPVTFTVVPILLGLVAIIACLLPARRASAIEPVHALGFDA